MHIPVLYEQIMYWLHPQPGGRYLDGTLGGAGHTRGLLSLPRPAAGFSPWTLIREAVARARESLAVFGERVRIVQGNFAELKTLAEANDFAPVQGIVLDLGSPLTNWIMRREVFPSKSRRRAGYAHEPGPGAERP